MVIVAKASAVSSMANTSQYLNLNAVCKADYAYYVLLLRRTRWTWLYGIRTRHIFNSKTEVTIVMN